MKNTKEIYIRTSNLSTNVLALKQFFIKNKIEAYLVGGAVRDACLNPDTEDLHVVIASSDISIGLKLAIALKG